MDPTPAPATGPAASRPPASARVATASAPVRSLRPEMRGLLAAFSVLTGLAVIALFVLSTETDQFFAWTIAPPLTAALMGAGYAAGFVLVVLSFRDPVWAHSRLAVLTILAFTLLTLAATVLHIDKFHLQSEFAALPWLARAAGWFWLGVYVVIPPAMVVCLVRQERAPGRDPAPGHPVPMALRVALAVEAAVLLAAGATLWAAPSTATTLWPWALTPLTARVVAAWLIAFGVATALASVAGDLARLRTSAVAYTVFGALTLVALARFPDTLEWSGVPAWALLGTTLAIVVTGAVGWRIAPTPPRRGSRTAAHRAEHGR
jgi:hypothetical protein